MKFTDMIKQSVLDGFSYSDMSTTKILITLLIAYVLALYIHLIYKFVTKNAFYYKNYGISMTILSVVTAGIILAMQSSLVISLGMVGALSIVRFRTAIKDPMDLLFLFWSIGSGIICGAGLFELALILAVVATLGILLFQLVPVKKGTRLLVINAVSREVFAEIEEILKKYTCAYSVKSKNIGADGMELIVEIRTKDPGDEGIVSALLSVADVDGVHLLDNEVDVKA